MGLDSSQFGALVGETSDVPRWSFGGDVDDPAPSIDLYTKPRAQIRRASSCACGSGLRYKHCCGWLIDEGSPYADVQVALVRRAIVLMQRGEARRAATLLHRLRAESIDDVWLALEAGEMCLDLDLLHQASALLQRAVAMGGAGARAIDALQECRDLIDRHDVRASASRALNEHLARLNARAKSAHNMSHVHIVCKLDTIGGTESRALNVYRQLSPHIRTTLWSTTPVLAAHAAAGDIRRISPHDVPAGGTLVLIGTYFDCGDWLETQPFDRVVICHNLATQSHSLENRLAQIESNPARPEVRLTFPSALFKDTAGLPGRVEFSPIDLTKFRRTRAHGPNRRLTIGRHGRAHPMKFHPNDPAFFRSVMARGHAVKILGGTQIAHCFENERGARPELFAVGARSVQAFLEDLDIFIYRSHPQFMETGGTVILEAMAMELPVIIFDPDRCGSTELIEHGENGFLVTTESAALDLIDRLTAEASLRTRIGCAARETVQNVMHRQAATMVDCYIA